MNYEVLALAVGPDGSLYAGGYFTTAGGRGQPHRPLGWRDFAWQRLGSGTNGSVYALALGPDGSLYAGGYFTTAGGVAANTSPAGTARRGIPWAAGCGYGHVSSLAWPDGSLYAGGSSPQPAAWQPTASPAGTARLASPGQRDERSRSTPWRLGRTARSTPGALHHRRRGGSQPHRPLGRATRVASSGQRDEQLSLWLWRLTPDGSLYAGGWFTTAGGVAANYIARWDGTTWHPLAAG